MAESVEVTEKVGNAEEKVGLELTAIIALSELKRDLIRRNEASLDTTVALHDPCGPLILGS